MTEQERKAKYAELQEIATEYASDKVTEHALKKRIENNNNTIKAMMELLNIGDVCTNNGDTQVKLHSLVLLLVNSAF